MSTKRINWQEAQVVEVPRPPPPACPGCGSGDYIGHGGFSNGDETTTQRATCRACSLPFLIVRVPLAEYLEDFPGREMGEASSL